MSERKNMKQSKKTATAVVQTLNAEMPGLDLYEEDIDIAHQLDTYTIV